MNGIGNPFKPIGTQQLHGHRRSSQFERRAVQGPQMQTVCLWGHSPVCLSNWEERLSLCNCCIPIGLNGLPACSTWQVRLYKHTAHSWTTSLSACVIEKKNTRGRILSAAKLMFMSKKEKSQLTCSQTHMRL